ncbi:extracellular solute-binding protein [Candidatus Electronema sp. JM]|uniref:extracellular solute-binding protein n=1 Tax=Candidatus Electronema sp. JM TaxID=3401571 RepID=UPI003AA9BE55
MKKLPLVLLSAAVCLVLHGCSEDKKEEQQTPQKKAAAQNQPAAQANEPQKLYIYNWTYYIPDQVVKDFESQNQVKVVYDMYASNEEMFTKLKAGGSGYDLVFPSGDYVSIMAKENMLEPIDKSKVPNFAHIDPAILAKIHFDEGNKYSVPYMMGAAGVAVNTKQVPAGFDKSWTLFNRDDLKGRMTMLDDMREVLGAALKSLGYSVNTKNLEELKKAKDLVKQWKSKIVKFDAESFAKGFAAGEFWVVQGYAENIFLELDEEAKKNVAFFIPKEGSAMYMDSMVLLKNAKNKDMAYKFMNYIHEPKVYAKIVDFLTLPSINVPARNLRAKKPNYEISDLARSEFKEDLGETLKDYNQVWQEIVVGE